MSEYRFHLEKYHVGSKITCPACNKSRCFVRYIDDEGVVEFPNTVGRCDHENSCGYHYTPKDYFHDNPDKAPKDWKDDFAPIYNKVSTIGEKKPESITPSFIPAGTMQKSLSKYEINPFYAYLCSIIGREEANRIFRMYYVGTANKWGGSTVFWQIDINGQVRAGKIMGYDRNTGHRIKEPQSQVTWAHSAIGIKDYHLVQCLFGEHLLPSKPTISVALVESEKTALIMTHFMPDLLWLATGGKDGCFNENAVQVLRGRTVILVPDLGAWEKWKKKSLILQPICQRVIMSDVIEKIATDEHREQGLDVADFFLIKPTKHEILADMIRRNPCVQTLIDKFKLEICEDVEEESRSPYRGLRW